MTDRPRTNPLRRPEPDLVDLPFGIRVALKRIVADMRDIPRECIFDRAELVHWINRMARRVEGVERTRVPAERPAWNAPKSPPVKAVKSEVEAAFKTPSQSTAKRKGTRTITSRKGKTVCVETRQLMLWG